MIKDYQILETYKLRKDLYKYTYSTYNKFGKASYIIPFLLLYDFREGAEGFTKLCVLLAI